MAVHIKKSSVLGALSITPLIDVLFLLLVFFLVTARFVEEDRELDVTLPSASSAQPLVAEPREIVIHVDQEGAYMIGGRLVDAAELEAALRQAAADNPAQQAVFIRADARVPFQAVATAMDLCNQAGIHDYSVATDTGEG